MLEAVLGLLALVCMVLVMAKVYSLSRSHPETLWNWSELDVEASLKEGFPDDFMWGTATAAFQVEGHNAPSNWTMWENSTDKKGVPRIHKGQKVGASCDHFNRYPEDIRRMREELGITVVKRIPVPPSFTIHNRSYLQTKVDRMGHMINITN